LYTSRLVVLKLGTDDFGLFGVTASLVALFAFINIAVTTSINRFFALEIGKQNWGDINGYFNAAVNIQIFICFVLFIMSETLGIWFIKNHLNIPVNRSGDIIMIFRFAVFSTSIGLILAPFQSLLLAFERFNIYAWLTVVESVLKFALIYFIDRNSERLLYRYALGMALISVVMLVFYRTFIALNYKSIRYKLRSNPIVYREMYSFSLWSVIGSFAWLLMNQGANIVINVFFGPALNAAKGVASQLDGMILTMSNNFKFVLNPSIIKAVSTDELSKMQNLSMLSSKVSFLIMLVFCVPLIIDGEFILGLWLIKVPEYTAIFVRLLLISSLLHSLDLSVVLSAKGKIKENQIYGGLIYVMVLPMAYLLYKIGFPVYTIYVLQIISTLVVDFLINAGLLNKHGGITYRDYYRSIIIPGLLIFTFTFTFSLLIRESLDASIFRVALICIMTLISSLIISNKIWFDGVIGNLGLNLSRKLFLSK
jgi:O-antigen/teichoic acid export membrane protein